MKKGVTFQREPKKWVLMDDGTHKNAYYASNYGEKSRREPEEFEQEKLDNGEPKYYFRGKCLRCRSVFKHAAIARGKGEEAFSVNMCTQCIIVTSRLTRIRGNGDKIWDDNRDCPKTFYKNLKSLMLDPDREDKFKERAEDAWLSSLVAAKERRDLNRSQIVKVKAEAHNVTAGHYLSWGFGDTFDEYFGHIDDNNQPTDFGVKFYSDGSVYVGPWLSGQQKTNSVYTTGTMIRPDGATYEGQWLGGRKQGNGRQIYADNSVYVGQFANGFEHGEGEKTYKDGSRFSGRFRFGRRDGQGILTLANGQVSKGTFRDSLMVHEKPPPPVFDGDMTAFENSSKNIIVQPKTLAKICLEKLSELLNPNKKDLYFQTSFVSRRVSEHLKPLISHHILSSLRNISPQYMEKANGIAFKMTDDISLDQIVMKHEDMDSFIYISEANTCLKNLRISTAKLEPTAVVILGRQLLSGSWSSLESLDLSFNSLEYRGLSSLLEGAVSLQTLQRLKLSGCRINPQLCVVIGKNLKDNKSITDLDLSFNMIGAKGAEEIGRALETNKGLMRLNLRSNDLGYSGGMAIVHGMRKNHQLKIVVLADNKVGDETITLLAGRVRGNISHLCKSLLTSELDVPELYQLPKEEDNEAEEEEESRTDKTESLLADLDSIQSEGSLSYNELSKLDATKTTNEND